MSDYIVIAHLPTDEGQKLVRTFELGLAEWMRGTRQQCEAKAEVWRRYYRNVQILKTEEVK